MKGKIVKLFYKAFQKEILKHQSELRKVDWKENCEFIVELRNPKTGKMQAFHKFKSTDLIPTYRYGLISDWLMQNNKKLTKNEQEKLIDGLVNYLKKMVNTYNEKKRVEHIESALWCARELKGRNSELMFHPEIMLELVALSIIREDENPGEINEAIHKEKMETFKTEGGAIPFYLQIGLGQLLPNWEGSMTESKELLDKQEEIIKLRSSIYKKIVGKELSTAMDKLSKTG